MLAPMKCPHCNVGIYESLQRGTPYALPKGVQWTPYFQVCPECKQDIVYLECFSTSTQTIEYIVERFIAYPSNPTLRQLPPEVPDPYRQDFVEAVAVLPLSPKASAALSRRNLQALIHDLAGVKGPNLDSEIQTIIDSGKVPSYVTEGLHAVRQLGNFAAHPIKSLTTGDVVPVEAGEAEWNLNVLESMFDFYFVQPAITAKRKAEMNKKLQDAGKPLLK